MQKTCAPTVFITQRNDEVRNKTMTLLLLSSWIILFVFLHPTLSDSPVFDSAEKTGRVDSVRKQRNAPYFGIPVPGQTISALDIFTFISQSCRPTSGLYQQRNLIADSIKLLANRGGEELAQQMYSHLYVAMSGVDMDKLMGKWYRVIDSRSVHQEKCVMTYYKMLHNTTYITTFTSKDYFRKGDTVHTIFGHGTKVGSEPGQQLFHTGHPADNCPYTLVKTGPLDEQGRYEYIILSQILKHPLMGLARDPKNFQLYYKDEVEKFLERHNFLNPLARSESAVTFEDFTNCPNDYYFDLED